MRNYRFDAIFLMHSPLLVCKWLQRCAGNQNLYCFLSRTLRYNKELDYYNKWSPENSLWIQIRIEEFAWKLRMPNPDDWRTNPPLRKDQQRRFAITDPKQLDVELSVDILALITAEFAPLILIQPDECTKKQSKVMVLKHGFRLCMGKGQYWPIAVCFNPPLIFLKRFFE